MAGRETQEGKGMSERCGYCTVSPENAEDYCDAHRPNWSAPPPPEPLNAEARRLAEQAEAVVDAWEQAEGESMRSGYRETLERLIEAALLRVQAEARADELKAAAEHLQPDAHICDRCENCGPAAMCARHSAFSEVAAWLRRRASVGAA
jgi:hypothetical protein